MVFMPGLLVFFLIMIFILAFTNTILAQTRTYGNEQPIGGSQGTFSQSAVPAGGLSTGSLVVPYMTVSERYDSNVLYSQTNKVADYVTNITAGARANYRGDMVDANFSGGLTSEVYMRNQGLNYIGTNATLNAVLDKSIGKMVRGMGMSISDTVVYTPRIQSWLTPEAPANSFISGIQPYRNNSMTNSSNVSSTYALNPSDLINASYSYELMRFFNTRTLVPGATGGLFNSDVQTLLTGLTHRINSTDSIALSYQYQQMSFVPNTGGVGFDVGVNSAMATWTKSITRELTAFVAPGASLVSSLPGELQWTMQARLEWRDAMTTAAVSYSRSVLPGFFLAGSAMLSDMVSALLSHQVASQWTVGAQSDYASSQSLGSQNGTFRFTSYGERVFVNYSFYRGFIASLGATYDHYTYSGIQMNRQTVSLSLTAEWN